MFCTTESCLGFPLPGRLDNTGEYTRHGLDDVNARDPCCNELWEPVSTGASSNETNDTGATFPVDPFISEHPDVLHKSSHPPFRRLTS